MIVHFMLQCKCFIHEKIKNMSYARNYKSRAYQVKIILGY